MSRPSTDEEGMSKNNAILNFGFLFGLINGLIDDKLCPTVIDDEDRYPNSPSTQGLCVCERVSQLISDGTYSSFSSEYIPR